MTARSYRDRGQLFGHDGRSYFWTEPDLFDQEAPQDCGSVHAVDPDAFGRCSICQMVHAVVVVPCQHVPGVVMAPVFGLPGPRTSTCDDCGAHIVKRDGTWATDDQ